MQLADGAPPVFALTQQGANTVMELRGRVDTGAAGLLEAHLRTTVAAGARQVIVDLTEAEDVPADVAAVLARTRADLRLLGGRLLVLGQEEHEAALGRGLIEAFAAYREVVGPHPAFQPPRAGPQRTASSASGLIGSGVRARTTCVPGRATDR
jgi:anti-anti-sigma regulatory factor